MSSRFALLLWLGALPATAQQATVTLVPDDAAWNAPIEARIEGIGCSGAFVPPTQTVVDAQKILEIGLLDCTAGGTSAFSIAVPLGPLYPDEYKVQVRDAALESGLLARTTPPPPLDEKPLTVRFAANLDLELPHVATDTEPVTITAVVPGGSPCGLFGGPLLLDHVVVISYDPSCPILPPPGFPIYRVPFTVGPLPAGRWEVRFFGASEYGGPGNLAIHSETLVVYEADRCLPSETTLCLGQGRFRVEAEWTDFAGHTGLGHARPLDGDGASGLLWFFGPDNVELTIKVLDGCGVNGNWWAFLSSGSTVEYTVTVTDTVSGQQRTYTNASGFSAPLVSDTSAFSCGS